MSIITPGFPILAERDIGGKVHAELTNLLFEFTWGANIAALLAILLIAFLFRAHVPSDRLWIWGGYGVTVELARFGLAMVFRARAIPMGRALRWKRWFAVGNAASGVTWGVAGFLLFLPSFPVYQLFLGAILFGACAIAVPLLAASFRMYLAYAIPALTPILLRLAFDGDPLMLIAVALGIVMLILLLSTALRMYRHVLEELKLRLAYAEVVEELSGESSQRTRVETLLRQGEENMRRQSQLLLELARESSISGGDIRGAYKAIAEKSADAINCERVSIWYVDNDGAYRCQHVYHDGTHDPSPELEFPEEHLAAFLVALSNARTLALDEVHDDPRVDGLRPDYLVPLGVRSLLIAPIRQGTALRGFILYEHMGEERQWAREEHSFASSVADFLLLAVTAEDRRRVEHNFRQLANYDRLTGLPNRALFMDRFAQALLKGRRSGGHIALLILDVDRFKGINDSLGHQSGDLVLRTIGKRILGCVRAADTVARLGGDEFTVILEEVDGVDTITNIADRILDAVSTTIHLGKAEAHLSTSIGISIYPHDGKDVDTLLQNADSAMYRAKDQGRNRYHFYTHDMHAEAMRRLSRETALRKALVREELLLHYQPQFDTRTGKIVGLEALVRWQDPNLGMIAPADFIPLAEDSGLIVQIGQSVLEMACRQTTQWLGLVPRPFHVAVNLSAGQFALGNLPQTVRKVIEDCGLPADMLQLEITESLFINGESTNIRLLRELKSMGIRLSLDDFGTGSSSLSYLKHFPVDALKIDRDFVTDIGRDPYDEAIAHSIIALAESLQLEVVAEGVENEEQMKQLQAMKCFLMQGFLFSRPLTVEATTALLEQSVELDIEI